MKWILPQSQDEIRVLLERGKEIPLAIQNYPSRGQTAVQKLYLTKMGKIFLKKTSDRNHKDTQIKKENGSLAEREYWSFCLAREIGLNIPELFLLDQDTTVQIWLPYPDAHMFVSRQGKLNLKLENVFDCGLFDWATGQIDRHDANFLYNFSQNEIILVDSAHAFLKYEGGMPDYLSYFEISNSADLKRRISSKVLKRILSLSIKKREGLVPLRCHEEKQSFEKRLQGLKKVQTVQNILDLYRGES